MNIQKIRKTVHNLSMTTIILGAFGVITVAGTCYLSIGYFRLICPVGFIELSLATRSINMELLIPFLIMSAILYVVGRSFCSWGCPTSYMGGVVRKMTSKTLYKKYSNVKKKVQSKVPQPGRGDVIAMMVGTLVGICVFQYPLPCTFCPLGVISRTIIEIANHTTITHFHLALRYDIVLLIIPIFAMFLFTRGWSQVCPVGNLKGFMSKYNKTFVPYTNDNCKNCKICEQSCPVNLGPRRGIPDMTVCIKCMVCAQNCPNNAIEILAISKDVQKKLEKKK